MDTRKVGIIVVAAGAALLAIVVLTRTWFGGTIYGNEFSVGLRSYEVCGGVAGCEVAEWSSLPGDPGRYQSFVRFGKVTFWHGLASAVLLLGVAALAGARKPQAASAAKLVLLNLTALTAFGLIYMVNKPTMFPGASWGVLGFMVGAMAAVVGTAMLSKRELYPADPADQAPVEAPDEYGGTFGL